MTEYKTEIGLRQTRVIDGKEVFVDWRGRPELQTVPWWSDIENTQLSETNTR